MKSKCIAGILCFGILFFAVGCGAKQEFAEESSNLVETVILFKDETNDITEGKTDEQTVTIEKSLEASLQTSETELTGDVSSDRLQEEQIQNINADNSTAENQSDAVKGNAFQERAQELKGWQYGADGQNIPVTISLYVTEVIRGEDAEQILSGSDPALLQPGEGEEYIIITLHAAYVDGGTDILYLTENTASLASANLSFSLQNGDSNAMNITAYLSDSIHNCAISKGESAEGRVAFIHNVAENGSLVFHGFDSVMELELSK